MVANMDPIHVGSVYAVFDRAFGIGLNTLPVEAVFHPRTNSVSLEFRYEFVSYRQFWDETARRQFIAALERYNEDFEARNLINRHRQTRSVYGRVIGRLEWQTARFTTRNVAYPIIELGYRFRENSPFFATLSRPTVSEETRDAGAGRTESRQLNMYFTRAQAADLARIFEQSYLLGILGMHDGGHVAPAVFDELPAAQDPSPDGYEHGVEEQTG